MRLPSFQYHAPKTLNALISLKEKYKDGAKIMAAGTELLPRMKLRLIKPEHIISILNIKALGNIKKKKDQIELGAGLRIKDLIEFFENHKQFYALHQAANMIGSQQIRNVATIGGNILQNTRCMFYNRSWQWQKTVPPCLKRGGNVCHAVKNSKRCFAVYQGDLAPVFISLDALVEFFSNNHYSMLPLEDIFTGDGLRPFNIEDGVLTKIILPEMEREKNCFSLYKKYRLREGLDFPLAGVAVGIHFNNKLIERIKLCITGVSSSPITLTLTGEFLDRKKTEQNLPLEIAKLAYNHVHPIDNLEAPKEKRRLLVKQMVFECIEELIKIHG